MSSYETSLVVSVEKYEIVGRVRGLPVLQTYSHDTAGQRIVILYVSDGMTTRFLWMRVSDSDDEFDWIRKRMNELELLDERMCRVGCMRGGAAGLWRMSLSRAMYTFSIMYDRGVLSCGDSLIETCDVSQLYERAVELMKREASIDDVMEFPHELREEIVRVCQE